MKHSFIGSHKTPITFHESGDADSSSYGLTICYLEKLMEALGEYQLYVSCPVNDWQDAMHVDFIYRRDGNFNWSLPEGLIYIEPEHPKEGTLMWTSSSDQGVVHYDTDPTTSYNVKVDKIIQSSIAKV